MQRVYAEYAEVRQRSTLSTLRYAEVRQLYTSSTPSTLRLYAEYAEVCQRSTLRYAKVRQRLS